jgi:hypothetical protein
LEYLVLLDRCHTSFLVIYAIVLPMLTAGRVDAVDQVTMPLTSWHAETDQPDDGSNSWPPHFSPGIDSNHDPNGFVPSDPLQPHESVTDVWGQHDRHSVSIETDNSNRDGEFSREMLKKLMRPSFDFAAEWQAKTDGIGTSSYGTGVKFPTFPLFGPPPPFISARFNYRSVDAPTSLGLPTDLYETELGLAWMRRINERWMTRFMAGASFATDGSNDSSDAWRFRGGGFAIYRRNSEWTWTFGVLALGRNDIPVVPAVGLIHQPSPGLRFDLIMPNPRISFLLVDRGPRQQWGYIGAGLNGSTWGIERVDGVDDQLTFGDFRAVLGWESTPTPEPGMPFTRGQKIGAEIGYVFSRDFEFENENRKVRLGDTLMFRVSMSF